MRVYMISCFSHVQFSVSLWTVALQAPLSMGFSRREYWRGLPCLPPGDLPDLGIKPTSPALWVDSLPTEPPGNPTLSIIPSESTMLLHMAELYPFSLLSNIPLCVYICVCVYTYLNTSSCTSAHVYTWHVQKSSPSCWSGARALRGILGVYRWREGAVCRNSTSALTIILKLLMQWSDQCHLDCFKYT